MDKRDEIMYELMQLSTHSFIKNKKNEKDNLSDSSNMYEEVEKYIINKRNKNV